MRDSVVKVLLGQEVDRGELLVVASSVDVYFLTFFVIFDRLTIAHAGIIEVP